MPIAKRSDVPQDFINQLKSNTTKTAPVETKEINVNKYADVMNVRLSKGRRQEIKAFCTVHGISVTQYIETSFEYLVREVEDGNISITKGGISKIAR